MWPFNSPRASRLARRLPQGTKAAVRPGTPPSSPGCFCKENKANATLCSGRYLPVSHPSTPGEEEFLHTEKKISCTHTISCFFRCPHALVNKQRRDNYGGEQQGSPTSPHRRALKKLPQKMVPTKPRARGPILACRRPPR